VVDEDTWAALDIQDSGITANWGTDENGNGTLEPNEITLQCA
jgi:hypothetical protein